MGYTHYWTLQRPITVEEVAAVGNDIRDIIRASELPIAYEYDRPDAEPQLDAKAIHYNGVGDDGHETFYIATGDSAFSFCKTAYKPYDVVVTASLLALKDRLGDDVRLTSDGEPEDWQAGFTLASRATGRFMPTPQDALGLGVEA